MNRTDIKRLITVGMTFRGYDEATKATFHRLGMKYLKELAKVMELAEGTYTVRSNKGGIAVLGEVTLHSDNLYVQIGGSASHDMFYFRCCRGQKDYTGGTNTWMKYELLEDMMRVAEILTRHLDSHRHEWNLSPGF